MERSEESVMRMKRREREERHEIEASVPDFALCFFILIQMNRASITFNWNKKAQGNFGCLV